MTPETLLIIGGGREQVTAYKIAKNMGLIVIGTDMDIDAPALKLADHQLICSTRDVNKTLEEVTKFSRIHSIHGVMTVANDVPYTVAKVAHELGLPGILPEIALLTANKILMKNKFIENKVNTPEYLVCETYDDFLSNSKLIDFPVILKPSDGRGSRGVFYLEEGVDLKWAWENSIVSSENKKMIIEQYIHGPQLSVEGLIVDSKFHPIAFADRNYDNMVRTKPYIVEDGGCIPSKYDDIVLNNISKLMDEAAKSLGLNWGPFKGDIVLSEDGPTIIEIAARLSGNYLATHHIPMAYGVDLVGAMIKLSLDIPFNLSSLCPKNKKFLGVRYFFPPTGKIKEIVGIKKVQEKDYLKYLDIYIKPGDIQGDITNHTGRAGTIICEAETYNLAIQRVENAVANIEFVI